MVAEHLGSHSAADDVPYRLGEGAICGLIYVRGGSARLISFPEGNAEWRYHAEGPLSMTYTHTLDHWRYWRARCNRAVSLAILSQYFSAIKLTGWKNTLFLHKQIANTTIKISIGLCENLGWCIVTAMKHCAHGTHKDVIWNIIRLFCNDCIILNTQTFSKLSQNLHFL